MNSHRRSLFGMQIDPVTMQQAIDRLLTWIQRPDGVCRYVVTPNVDHAVLFREHRQLQSAYADASLVLVDGFPVLLAAKLFGRGIPERVPGSDLVPALFETINALGNPLRGADPYKIALPTPLRVFLLGAKPGVGQRAAHNIETRWPRIEVAGACSPPLGFERSPHQNEAILSQIADARPDVLVVGLGAPKQELWVHNHRAQIAVPVALCVGGTIDFLAGEKARAPVWMRRVGLEWLHRVATEPRRLAKRYFRDALIFPQLVARELVAARRWTTANARR